MFNVSLINGHIDGMTPQEALKILDETVIGNLELKVVLSAALEKQIPKKVEEYLTSSFCCPVCTAVLSRYSIYCSKCGQALDWSDSE